MIKKITLEDRLKTKTDLIIINLIWLIYLITFFALLNIPSDIYGGLEVAGRFGIIFLIFPFGLTIGMISDRYLAKKSIKEKSIKSKVNNIKEKKFKICLEDIYRLIIISIITFISIPWIAALFGIPQILFFKEIHIGEQHGYYGYLLILFAVLNTKIIKYNEESIAREIIIFGFTFFAVLGLGLMIDDLLIEQFNIDIQFTIPFYENFDFIGFSIQMIVIFSISIFIYYLFWCKYYYKKIKEIQNF